MVLPIDATAGFILLILNFRSIQLTAVDALLLVHLPIVDLWLAGLRLCSNINDQSAPTAIASFS
jgi:hypothetical protein